MTEATLNGENLVKLSKKMTSKLKGFLKKVGEGLSTVPYIPGAAFEVTKLSKKDKQKDVIPFGKRVEAFVNKTVETAEKKKTAGKTNQVQEAQDKSEENQTKSAVKRIQGKSAADLLKASKKEDKSQTAYAENIRIKSRAKSKAEQEKKEKKDLTDLTIFESYEDYKYAFFYNYFINDKKYEDNLDDVAKLLAKTADTKKYRTMLDEGKFNAKKTEQAKEKEIDSIRKAEAENNARLDAKRDAAIQRAKDDAQSTIDTLQAKLTESRSKNRVLTAKLKVNTEALAAIAEISTTIGGIKAIDDVITKADESCQGIDKRAEKKEKNKDDKEEKSAIESDVDRRMKSINESVYGKKEKTESKSVVASTVQDPTQKEELTTETDSASLVNELASYDDKEIASQSIFDNTISDPKVELETVPFIPSWKLGSVESQMATKTLSDATTAQFNKMVEENNKSHGRTR